MYREEGEHALTNEAFPGRHRRHHHRCDPCGDFLDKATDFENDIWERRAPCSSTRDTEALLVRSTEPSRTWLRWYWHQRRAGSPTAWCATTWGATPGHPLEDIESGAVHNTTSLTTPKVGVRPHLDHQHRFGLRTTAVSVQPWF